MEQQLPVVQLLANGNNAFFMRPIIIEADTAHPHEDPHRHNFQEILWVRSGSGQHAIDGSLLNIQPNSFYLIAKGQVHQFISGNQIDGLLIRFADAFLPDFPSLTLGHYQTALFNNLCINHTLTVSPSEAASFEQLLALIALEQEADESAEKYEILRHLLTAVLIKLVQVQKTQLQAGNTAVDNDSHLLHQFTTMLEEQFSSSHSVKSYAAALHISPRQLSNISSRYLGTTAKLVIEERLTLEAKRYLTFTNLSIKERAFALGYKDPSYFSKSFKKQTGVAPQAYKG
jgi:AraC family transcriptional activator of pobA